MVHRTVLGSMERFLASLIEHYGGAFPIWLAPVQVKIVPVADRHLDYANELETRLKDDAIRAEIDSRSERMNLKIRQAQLEKIPYVLVIGDREAASNTVSVRLRDGSQFNDQSLDSFKETVKSAIIKKAKDISLPR